MAEVIYLLCALTSIGCAGLLIRTYVRRKTPLLLWSSLSFVGLAVNNILLLVDLVLMPSIDFSVARSATALVSLILLLYGFIWDTGAKQ